MATTFDDVTASLDKTSYAAGETIRIAISGQAEGAEVDEQVTLGPVDLPVVADDGTQAMLHLPATDVTLTTSQVTAPLNVLIDPTRAVVDSGAIPRQWAVSADRKSITAVA